MGTLPIVNVLGIAWIRPESSSTAPFVRYYRRGWHKTASVLFYAKDLRRRYRVQSNEKDEDSVLRIGKESWW